MSSELPRPLRSERRPPEVVVVEDDDGLGLPECRELERAGFTVRVVETGAGALRAATERPPDCWLIGQNLPDGMSGLQLVAALRQAGHYAPAILITGQDDPDVLLQAMRGGVRDFVRKGPGFAELLVSRVNAVIETVQIEQALERTQAKAEAEALRRRELESEIAERRKAENLARHAIERLEEVDRRKDAFLAMLGHELRNPLAPISNAVEVLRLHGSESTEVRWAVGVVGRQIAQLRRLVDDLLDVARISYGRFQLAFAPVLLSDVVLNAVERCRSILEARHHRLLVTQAPEPMSVYGDSTRLEQALVNLLDNAAKYSPEGGTVSLSVTAKAGEGVIRVADNGIGIRAEDLDSIFQLFVQGERDMARSQGGLGVGLSLVRRVAELHGGRIEAFSAGVGKGSEFQLYLPLSRIMPAPAASEPATPVAMPGKRVIVVDDDIDSAESMAMLLRLWGFLVESAHDGESALALIETVKPDAVLLDLGLPGLDGLGVAERVHQLPGHDELLLIAVTGYGQQSDRDRTRQAGFSRHLVKPVAAVSLRETLAPLLQP